MNKPTVLCVDDERSVLNAIRRELRHEPYEVVFASSGQEGLDRMLEGPVSVVVSDQNMPQMTGAEFLAHVKEIWPNAYRVMLTGYSDIGRLRSRKKVSGRCLRAFCPLPRAGTEVLHFEWQGQGVARQH